MTLEPAESASLDPSSSREESGGTGCYPGAVSGPPVAGAYAWYDPSDAASVTVSAAGLVTAIADKSGNARHSTSVTGNVVLARRLGMFAERAALYFESAAGNRIGFTGVTMSDVSFSLFAVAMVQTVTSRNPCILGPSADGGIELRINSSAGDRKVYAAAADVADLGDNDAAPIVVGTPFVAGLVLSATEATLYSNLNGETDAHAVSLTAARTLTMGEASTVAGGGERMFGYIGETVLYDSTLSVPNAEATIAYLMAGWGIS